MSAKENMGKNFAKGAKGRANFLVFGLLAVAIASAAAFVSKKNATPSEASVQVMQAPNGNSTSVTDANKASEEYLNTLKASNKVEIENAEKTGASAVSTLTARAVKVDQSEEKSGPLTVVVAQDDKNNHTNPQLPQVPQFASPQGGTMAVGQTGVANGGQQQSHFDRNKALAAQVNELLGTWAAPGASMYVNRSETVASVADNATAQAASQAAAQQAAASAEPVAPVLIPAGKLFSAVLETESVSDDNGPVQATVVSGPYKDAKLIGTMTVLRNSAKVSFNLMSFKGVSAPITAVALDPETGRSGMADEVDKHWFEKYGTVFLASFVGGYGDAASTVGTTVTQTSGSTVVQQDPLSPKLRTQVALGKSGSAVAQQFAQDAAQIKTTITLHQSRAIGVLFLKDVISQ